MAKIDSCRALELNSQESIIGYEFGDFIRDIETNSAPSPIPADVLTYSHDIRIYLKGKYNSHIIYIFVHTVCCFCFLLQY